MLRRRNRHKISAAFVLAISTSQRKISLFYGANLGVILSKDVEERVEFGDGLPLHPTFAQPVEAESLLLVPRNVVSKEPLQFSGRSCLVPFSFV